jgi:hypothetical protein
LPSEQGAQLGAARQGFQVQPAEHLGCGGDPIPGSRQRLRRIAQRVAGPVDGAPGEDQVAVRDLAVRDLAVQRGPPEDGDTARRRR